MIRLLVLSVIFCSCSSMNQKFGLPDDNFIEETVEDVIRHETGFDVDLTPKSRE